MSYGQGGNKSDGRTDRPWISGTGRYVVFRSTATNLIGNGDTNGVADVFLHDRVTRRTTRETRAAPDVQADRTSFEPALDEDGGTLAFTSLATNLVDGDVNGRQDVFLLGTPGSLETEQ